MASDALYIAVGVGSPLASAGVSYVLTIARDRRRDARAEAEREAAEERARNDERVARLENQVGILHDQMVTSDVLSRHALRDHREDR